MSNKKQTAPFFSIIIPTLNEEFYLPNLLNDLKSQTFTNFEVLVVDAKSEDKTVSIAKKYQANVLLSTKKNVSFQRNLGAQKAQGKYLIIIDADTRIPQSFLWQININLQKKSVDFFSSKIGILYKSNISFNNKLIIMGNNLFISILCFFNKPKFSIFIGIKKTVFFQISGYNENYKISEDHDLCSRLSKNHFKYKFYTKPTFEISFRRFEKEGYFKVILKWLLSYFYLKINQPQLQKKLNYNMGGNFYSPHTNNESQ